MYTLEQEQKIDRKPEDISPLYAKSENLSLLTPRWLKFKINKKFTEGMRKNTQFVYTLKFYNVSMFWERKFTKYNSPHLFIDEQLICPYKEWMHSHTFEAGRSSTVMIDIVEYNL